MNPPTRGAGDRSGARGWHRPQDRPGRRSVPLLRREARGSSAHGGGLRWSARHGVVPGPRPGTGACARTRVPGKLRSGDWSGARWWHRPPGRRGRAASARPGVGELRSATGHARAWAASREWERAWVRSRGLRPLPGAGDRLPARAGGMAAVAGGAGPGWAAVGAAGAGAARGTPARRVVRRHPVRHGRPPPPPPPVARVRGWVVGAGAAGACAGGTGVGMPLPSLTGPGDGRR